MVKQLDEALTKIRSIADYQFGQGAGEKLFPEKVDIQYSNATGRIRYIGLNGKRLATLRPTDGLLSISVGAARVIKEKVASAQCFVTVQQDVSKYIAEGGDIFAVHIFKADDEIHAKDEVIAVDEKGQVDRKSVV